MSIFRLFTIAFVAMAMAGPGCGRPPSTPHAAPLDSLTARLDLLVPKLLKDRSVPGTAIAVVQNGTSIWSRGYGLADKHSSKPVTPETRFNIGSASKTMASWGAMTLVGKGLVDLDAPVDRYLKRWHLPPSSYDNNKVTLRRLLTHTSGLTVYPMNGPVNGHQPGEKTSTLEEALSRSYYGYGKLRLVKEPGTAYQYNNGNYVIIQLLIEDVSGQTFADYMQKTVFNPLTMKSTGYAWTPELAASVAIPYDQNGDAWPYFLWIEQASGGVFTTAHDLALFVAAIDSGGGKPPGRGLLSAETVSLMIKPASETNGQYGIGYQMSPLKKNGHFVVHQGANEGFRSLFLFDTATRCGIVILTNSDLGGRIVGEVVCTWAKWAGVELAEPCPEDTR